jgi:nitrile hydratase accessory protein
MAGSVDRDVTLMQGKEALPRKNGELVFEAPWQARALGMAVALSEQGLYRWDDFKSHLIAEIAEASEHPHDQGESPATSYYESWLASLEHVLVDMGVCSPQEIERRVQEFASGAREEVY